MNEAKIRQTLSLSILVVLVIGLVSVIGLLNTSQDMRQNAQQTGNSVQLRLSAKESGAQVDRGQTITTSSGKVVETLIESVSSTASVAALDFVVTYDAATFEFVSAELPNSKFPVLLKKDAATAGKVRLAIGKQPGATISGNQQIAIVNLRVKDRQGASSIGIETQTAKVAVVGSSANAYQAPTTPITVNVGTGGSTESTSVQARFKFAGIPVENNPNFLPEAARTQPVKISLQNIATGEITAPVKLSSLFASNQFSLVTPFTSTTVQTGKYNILIKGPKHQQIRFCKNDQAPDYRCQLTDGIDLTKNTTHTFDFTKRPLSCGDLPISGSNNDQQDGVVRVTDYSFMVGCLSKRTDAACVARADCNADGTVTNLDMDLLLETLSNAYDQ
ncbi:MAG: cohesin domain-containing protein [bacterium]|nr:cohesin domain-containing protein [bacterium]